MVVTSIKRINRKVGRVYGQTLPSNRVSIACLALRIRFPDVTFVRKVGVS